MDLLPSRLGEMIKPGSESDATSAVYMKLDCERVRRRKILNDSGASYYLIARTSDVKVYTLLALSQHQKGLWEVTSHDQILYIWTA